MTTPFQHSPETNFSFNHFPKESHMIRRASLSFGLAAILVALSSPLTAVGEQDSKLAAIVRNATQQYQNVANASPDYGPVLGCVSGPDHGAMGVHYVNLSLVNGGTLLGDSQNLDPAKPQALIYEPQPNGEMKLVAVEYIILAGALPANAAPQVEGHLMQLIGSPNRYGLPAFYELHVWAWKENPQGSFADWNNHVSCDHQ
jgi:hypothetical protein